MAPIVTSWSSLDYENGQQQRSNKMKQHQSSQPSLSVYQPFRLRQSSVSVTPPSMNSSLKSYGSVSSFESADPFASLLPIVGGANPGPTKPPRALHPSPGRGTGNRHHPPPLSIGGHDHPKFHHLRHPQGQIVNNRSKSHSDLVNAAMYLLKHKYASGRVSFFSGKQIKVRREIVFHRIQNLF